MSTSQSATATDRSKQLLETAKQVLAPTYNRPDQLFTSGQGAWLIDAEGNEYLDMSSGIAVLALGHRAPTVADAIHSGANELVHISNLYHSAPPIELAAKLVELSFADSVFFANSGTEAVEAALKFARLAAGNTRSKVIHFSGSFHGRTMGALAATDRPDYQDPFRPLPLGFDSADWNSDEGLAAITDNVAAVILEPIQGEMGVREADPDWVVKIRQRCHETGAFLIFDEIQCGLGRTGQLWAHHDFGVTPDMMTLAKPLAGGLPIGAVLMTRAIADSLSPGVHGTTFGGGPLVTRVALRVLEHIADPGFLENVRRLGRHLGHKLAALTSLPEVEEIRGRGLIRGVQLDNSKTAAKTVVDAAYQRGLLVVPSADNVVRILPPLNAKEQDLDLCVERLKESISATEEESS